MSPEELISKYASANEVKTLYSNIEAGLETQLKGIIGSSLAFIAAGLQDTPGLFILPDKEEAAYLFNDLEYLFPKEQVFFLPSSARHPYQTEKVDNTSILQRSEVLDALNTRKKPLFIVSYPEALIEKVVSKKHLESHTLQIKVGDELSIDFITEVLIEYQFEMVDFVYQPGQFAVRGGIVDIFSYANDYPYRLEFFGDDVESIRSFETDNQLSQKQLDRITVVPNIREEFMMEVRSSFTDFLKSNTCIWIKDAQLVYEKCDKAFEKAKLIYEKLDETSLVKQLAPEELYLSGDDLQKTCSNFTNVHYGLSQQGKQDLIPFDQKPQPSFKKNFELLIDTFKKNQSEGITNVLASANAKQIERLYHIFEDLQADVSFQTINANLHSGFIDHNIKTACFTDHQIFERYHRFRLKEGYKQSQQAITLKELTDLKKGDYITHIDHGVGQFDGLQKIDVNGKEQEAIRLIYKEGDILYVSIHSLHRISKYSGSDGGVPKINKLGSKAWQKLKDKTKSRVKKVAFDLIKLYAKRKAEIGFQFSPDNYLQNELEASFIYEDTPDQLKTTIAVKEDMEASYPMDRLVCGDVGFGKTEIAIRAAFKAVNDSKQVVILAPTTILTLQHYKTFAKRLKDFPCTVDYINRFKSSAQQKDTLKRLAEGKIDIIIGTHRIVSKDVKFKDLGLLIIDEEQKFGVSVKDKLKTFKANVDTLTLTATPIPRTLQFSLMNARDLSIIQTPPPNRQPVQTELHGLNEALIKEVIDYEVARGGQVFFVHNRVQNIAEVKAMVERACPGVAVQFAHGQMDPKELEDVMMSFIDGEFDVLIATTIIESGLDIPNANTIIINNAHSFGLSDLHQMRGRVGRSNKKAFCYLLTPPLSTISSDSRKRLQAIEQFSDLGSGFNIAMKDLDIRGAGNLLGGEQSGFISEIGFDMYQKILDEAIQELKESEFKDLFKEKEADSKVFVKDCSIETDFEIMIPDDYVNNVSERVNLYRELAKIEDIAALKAFQERLVDRFGEIPKPTGDLIDSLQLKWAAKSVGLERLIIKSQKMIGMFVANQESAFYSSPIFSNIIQYLSMNPSKGKLKEKNDTLRIVFEGVTSLEVAIRLVNDIKEHALVQPQEA
ncbi:MAG: transcription-repair coupling factor [Flavobacteriales bacterium]|nr:transcription-repair coupling factor [Flavobacteriales bacterium]